MFLPHIQTQPAAEPAPVVVSPVPIVISRNHKPTTDRDACIDVLCGDSWLPLSYHDNATTAVDAFHRMSRFDKWGNVEERFRILCHVLDLNEFESIAIEQPKRDWEL